MKPQKTVSFRMDADKVETLDKIAANMRRDRTFLLNEAVDAYLDWFADFERVVREGMEAARKGQWVEHDEVRRIFANHMKKRKTA